MLTLGSNVVESLLRQIMFGGILSAVIHDT